MFTRLCVYGSLCIIEIPGSNKIKGLLSHYLSFFFVFSSKQRRSFTLKSFNFYDVILYLFYLQRIFIRLKILVSILLYMLLFLFLFITSIFLFKTISPKLLRKPFFKTKTKQNRNYIQF